MTLQDLHSHHSPTQAQQQNTSTTSKDYKPWRRLQLSSAAVEDASVLELLKMIPPNCSQLVARAKRVPTMPLDEPEQKTDMAAMDDDVTWWTIGAVAFAALLQIYNVLACGRTTASWVCPRRAENSSVENAAQPQPRTPCRPLARSEHMNSEPGTQETPTRATPGDSSLNATLPGTNRLQLAHQTPIWQILKPNICAGVLSAMHRWRLLVIRTIQDAEHTRETTEYIQRQACTHMCPHRERDDTKTMLVVCACFMCVCVRV